MVEGNLLVAEDEGVAVFDNHYGVEGLDGQSLVTEGEAGAAEEERAVRLGQLGLGGEVDADGGYGGVLGDGVELVVEGVGSHVYGVVDGGGGHLYGLAFVGDVHRQVKQIVCGPVDGVGQGNGNLLAVVVGRGEVEGSSLVL